MASLCCWNRAADLPDTDLLAVAMRENASMSYRPMQLWSVGLESFLRHIRYPLPTEGLRAGDEWVRLPVADVLAAFDSWWCHGFSTAPSDPRVAPSNAVVLSTYEHWFATAPVGDGYSCGCKADVPGYVAATAGIPAQHVRSLAAFRLGAHCFEVATGRWVNRPRSQRVCQLCGAGVGDEFHVVFECSGQEVPRQIHAPLFEAFGGWSALRPTDLPGDAMRQFMSQNPRWVASFINACEKRAQDDPPDAVVFGDPVESSEEFVDCFDEEMDVILDALDSALEIDGFMSFTP